MGKYENNHHFSHHHILNPLTPEPGEKLSCKACEQDITEPFHGCLQCHHYLHDRCLNTARSLEHPSHPAHPLALLPMPTYFTRSYSCNACGSVGNAFSYSCSHCEFDLHLHCAALPHSVRVAQHSHELKLQFGFENINENIVFVCDICRARVDRRFWFYCCALCDFEGHVHCATGVTQRGSTKGAQTSSIQSLDDVVPDQVKLVQQVANAQNTLNYAKVMAQFSIRGSENALELIRPSYERRY